MNIETVNDLAEQIADWIGIYGGCKNESSPDSDGVNECTYDKFKNPLCCRTGFVSAMEERIREAVENDKILNLK